MDPKSVRKQKSGDQLAVGDWIAPGALMERPAEVLFVYAYPSDADAVASGLVPSRERGTSVQLVVREQGRTGVWPDLASANTLFNLASDEDLATYREQAERAQKIADIRALADFLDANPAVPAPDSVHAQASPGRHGDVWNSGAEGIAEVRRVAEIFCEKVRQDDERTEVVKRFGGFDYTFIAWHKDGRPAEPDTLSDAELDEVLADANRDIAAALDDVVDTEAGLRAITDPTGLSYSREADDPTPVSGARVVPHVGGVTEAGLVDETASVAECGCPVHPYPEGRGDEADTIVRHVVGICTEDLD